MTTILHRIGLGKRTLVMGVLNVTPDSFSDGGRYSAIDAAIERGVQMMDEGADIVDIGGESTRPSTFRDGAPLDPAEERARILPVIRGLRECSPDACISVDSYKADVAEAAIDAGAQVINDVSGLGYDPRMAQVAASRAAPLILMHMPGTPRHMPDNPDYGNDIIARLGEYFTERAARARSAGVAAEQIVIDPGLGFGKNAEQNLELIRRLPELKVLGYPVLSGPSRKSFIGKLLDNAPADDRLEGTSAAIALSIAGGADIVRVHDVRFISRLVRVCDAILGR